MMATISPNLMSAVNRSSALTPLAAEGVLPAQQRRGRELDQPVGGLAQNCKNHDRRQDLRRLAELLAVEQQIAETFGGAHQFGRDHEHPAQAQADP
jgi:hypothetical protein